MESVSPSGNVGWKPHVKKCLENIHMRMGQLSFNLLMYLASSRQLTLVKYMLKFMNSVDKAYDDDDDDDADLSTSR